MDEEGGKLLIHFYTEQQMNFCSKSEKQELASNISRK